MKAFRDPPPSTARLRNNPDKTRGRSKKSIEWNRKMFWTREVREVSSVARTAQGNRGGQGSRRRARLGGGGLLKLQCMDLWADTSEICVWTRRKMYKREARVRDQSALKSWFDKNSNLWKWFELFQNLVALVTVMLQFKIARRSVVVRQSRLFIWINTWAV